MSKKEHANEAYASPGLTVGSCTRIWMTPSSSCLSAVTKRSTECPLEQRNFGVESAPLARHNATGDDGV
jgi:hypothetical protein